jgi:hypothetical protein
MKQKKPLGNVAYIGVRVPQEIADRLGAYCKKRKTSTTEVVRGLLETILLTPDERLADLKIAEQEFQAGVDALRLRVEQKIERVSSAMYVHEAGESGGSWVDAIPPKDQKARKP